MINLLRGMLETQQYHGTFLFPPSVLLCNECTLLGGVTNSRQRRGVGTCSVTGARFREGGGGEGL